MYITANAVIPAGNPIKTGTQFKIGVFSIEGKKKTINDDAAAKTIVIITKNVVKVLRLDSGSSINHEENLFSRSSINDERLRWLPDIKNISANNHKKTMFMI